MPAPEHQRKSSIVVQIHVCSPKVLGHRWNRIRFRSMSSVAGRPGSSRSPITVHFIRTRSPKIEILASLTASVPIFDSQWSLENLCKVVLVAWSDILSISEEGRLLPVNLIGKGSGASRLCSLLSRWELCWSPGEGSEFRSAGEWSELKLCGSAGKCKLKLCGSAGEWLKLGGSAGECKLKQGGLAGRSNERKLCWLFSEKGSSKPWRCANGRTVWLVGGWMVSALFHSLP